MREIIYGINEQDSTAVTKPNVVTVGFFDGVHLGHQHLIRQVVSLAHDKGMESTVVTFSRHPRQVLQPRFKPQLLTTFEEKISLLTQTGVDNCVVLDFTKEMAALSARSFMQQVLRDQLHAHCLITGYDNKFGHNREEGFDDYVRHGQELGIEVLQSSPLTVGDILVSSSTVRRQLLDGDIEAASSCLGRRYSFAGKVVSGFQQGRKLGFPTANIELDDSQKLLPKTGVYAAKVLVEGEAEYKLAVMNIGVRPTFDGHEPTIEVHVIRYQGDLYGRRMTVCPYHRWRGEHKFETLDLLVAQMHEDVENTDSYFGVSDGQSAQLAGDQK